VHAEHGHFEGQLIAERLDGMPAHRINAETQQATGENAG
jgi:hypothetical protein